METNHNKISLKKSYYEGKAKRNWNMTDAQRKEYINKLKEQNLNILNKRDRVSRKIVMVDSKTLEEIRTFDSRFKAAEYISSINGRNPYTVYGNMTMCMANGYKSYGHYWKIIKG